MGTRTSAIDAYPTLKSHGFEFLRFGGHRRNGSEYWIMDTPNGRKKVKVVPRKFNPYAFRYWIGIACRLVGFVDLWVIWCEKEPYMYAVPDAVVKRIWEQKRQDTSPVDKFDFNFHLDTGRVEHPMMSLRKYRIDLNAKVA